MKKIILAILSLALLTSCHRKAVAVSTSVWHRDSTVITETIRYRDTTIVRDSSISLVKIICDSTHKPQIVSYRPISGRSSPRIISSIDPTIFNITCPADSLTLRIGALEREKYHLSQMIERSKEIVTTSDTFWQKLTKNIVQIILHVVWFVLAAGMGAVFYAIRLR